MLSLYAKIFNEIHTCYLRLIVFDFALNNKAIFPVKIRCKTHPYKLKHIFISLKFYASKMFLIQNNPMYNYA